MRPGFREHIANSAVLFGWGELGVGSHAFYPYTAYLERAAHTWNLRSGPACNVRCRDTCLGGVAGAAK